ncbi:helix-turn-helix transcriptional regulator [Paenibacillus segetis]|uniref:Uncharacterized protein n=1 Tax=Paenibacillus segetis TaxID=1325360 RepID=A0ABQ1Y5P0_9BACL|nr:PAS domain-containing protein [Paenibacillus segetis]GGH12639.1 hypothetical protein GCM10008013_05180 [Paenibacillus segetis]
MDEQRAILETYFPIASLITSIVGPKCEVVIHDIFNPEQSVIYLTNGHISGRKVGDGATDLVLKLLKGNLNQDQPFIANYIAEGPNGQKFRSSTYFIRNHKGELIGLMCINIDITQMKIAEEWIQHLLYGDSSVTPQVKEDPPEEKQVTEYLQGNVEDLLRHMIKTVLGKLDVTKDRLTSHEKQELVKALNNQGVFLLKGGVSEVARSLGISEPTVYRYLQKLK